MRGRERERVEESEEEKRMPISVKWQGYQRPADMVETNNNRIQLANDKNIFVHISINVQLSAQSIYSKHSVDNGMQFDKNRSQTVHVNMYQNANIFCCYKLFSENDR